MNIRILQPRLKSGAIEENLKEVATLITAQNDTANEKPSLYVCGLDTTLGDDYEKFIGHSEILPRQNYALEALREVLAEDILIIGGVADPSSNGALRQAYLCLTKERIIAIDIEDEKPTTTLLYHGYPVEMRTLLYEKEAILFLAFKKPKDESYLFRFGRIVAIFSPFQIALKPDYNAILAESTTITYLVNRVAMVNGHLQGGYSGCLGSRDNAKVSLRYPEYDNPRTKAKYLDTLPTPENYSYLHDAYVLALRMFFMQIGQKNAILGLSGGIDSALVLVLAAEALGAENVLGVIMPSQYTARESVSSAEQLAQNLGVKTKIISIEPLIKTFSDILVPYFQQLPPDATEENLQARIRAVLLMAFSNKWGHILLNTSNKSEIAVGYSTMYGDACGALSVIGALYKTQVYEMVRYINREQEIIPRFIIDRPPTAELRPDQSDQDSLPPYKILDAILQQLIDHHKEPSKIEVQGGTAATISQVATLVKHAAYKRYQMPPCLRIAPDSFFDK